MIRRSILTLTLVATALLPALGSHWRSQDDGPTGGAGSQDRGGEGQGG